MKKIFLLLPLSALLVAASCSNTPKATIEGTIANSDLDGKKIYFYSLDIDSLETTGPVLKDSTEIVSGKFSMKEDITDNPSLGLIGLGQNNRNEENPMDIFVVMEPGTIKVNLDGQRVTIGGTSRNDALNTSLYSIMNQTIDIRKEVDAAGGNIQAVPVDKNGDDVTARMKNKSKEIQKGLYSFVKDNMTNRAGEVLFMAMGQSFKMDQQMELINMSDTSFQARESIKQLKEVIDFQKQKEASVVGTNYKDITLLNKQEKQEGLSKHIGKGKYVFIDFWATWCRPCLEEMPSLIAVYEKYKGKDFEMVGVSLDQDKNAWLQALTMMNLQWVQLFDADQVAGKTYEIAAIPYTLLVDKEGKIIAMNLSADDLDDKLEELLK